MVNLKLRLTAQTVVVAPSAVAAERVSQPPADEDNRQVLSKIVHVMRSAAVS